MILRVITRPLVALFFSLLLLVAAPLGAAAQAPATAPASTDQALKPEALEALVAPIALYPDPLLAQVLMASTYPLEVVQAERWVDENKSLKDDKLKAAVDKQAWDDSVKGLVATPSVLEMMSSKLDWTQKLGDAVLAQQPDVMDAIQRLRARAQANNKLQINPAAEGHGRQQQPSRPSRQVIAIEPADRRHASTCRTTTRAWSMAAGPMPTIRRTISGYPGYIARRRHRDRRRLRRRLCAAALGRGQQHLGRRRSIGATATSSSTARSTSTTSAATTGQHNPAHRQGVRYSNANVQQRFGNNSLRAGAAQRMDFRGRGGQQVLNPGGDRRRAAIAAPAIGRAAAAQARRTDRGAGNRPGGERPERPIVAAPAPATAARQPRATTRPAARSGGARGNAFGNIGPGRAAGLASARGAASVARRCPRRRIGGGGMRGGGMRRRWLAWRWRWRPRRRRRAAIRHRAQARHHAARPSRQRAWLLSLQLQRQRQGLCRRDRPGGASRDRRRRSRAAATAICGSSTTGSA